MYNFVRLGSYIYHQYFKFDSVSFINYYSWIPSIIWYFSANHSIPVMRYRPFSNAFFKHHFKNSTDQPSWYMTYLGPVTVCFHKQSFEGTVNCIGWNIILIQLSCSKSGSFLFARWYFYADKHHFSFSILTFQL